MNKKLYEIPLNLGVDLQSPLSMIGKGRLGYMKNLICKGGLLSKRNGYKSIATFLDDDFSPLRINGIYNYSVYNDENELTPCYILHAGTNIYRCASDFSSYEKIPLADGAELQDTKTRGFLVDNNLFIVGNKEVLVYDGEKIKSPYSVENLYVPTTTVGITDHRNGMLRNSSQSANLLSGRRINTLKGSNLYVSPLSEEQEAPIFLLDSDIAYNARFTVNVRIRVRKSSDPVDETTSVYVGVNSMGEEVNTIVNVRYALDYLVAPSSAYLLREPIIDDEGNEIRIKLADDDIRGYEKLGWALGLKSKNEIFFTFDLTPPVIGQDNITVEFEAREGKSDFIYSTIGALANSNTGGAILLLCYDNNKIAYSLPRKEGLYFPKDNCISIGNVSSPIKGILQMHDNSIGVYKENSFYRLVLENDDGLTATVARAYYSGDEFGAVNEYVLCNVDSDSVSFGDNGVYGYTSSYSSLGVSPCLTSRGKRVETELCAYSKSEKERAVAICHDRRYYLFIGDKVYIADARYKTPDPSGNSGVFEYEWWIWQGFKARVAVSLNGAIYLGTENGDVLTFDEEFSDRYSISYRVTKGELACKNDGEKTVLYFDMETPPDTCEAVYLGEHEALFSKSALCISENGTFKIANTDFVQNGKIALYDGIEARLYDSDGQLAVSGKIYESDISKSTFKIASDKQAAIGKAYTVYFYYKQREAPYELCKNDDGYILMKNAVPVLIKDTSSLCVFADKNEEIECEMHTGLISFSEPSAKKTLTRVLIMPSAATEGELELVYESEKNKCTRRLNITSQVDFNSFNLEAFSFSDVFGKAYLLPCLERNFRFIRFKIKSSSRSDFGIESIFCRYSTIKGGI